MSRTEDLAHGAPDTIYRVSIRHTLSASWLRLVEMRAAYEEGYDLALDLLDELELPGTTASSVDLNALLEQLGITAAKIAFWRMTARVAWPWPWPEAISGPRSWSTPAIRFADLESPDIASVEAIVALSDRMGPGFLATLEHLTNYWGSWMRGSGRGFGRPLGGGWSLIVRRNLGFA